MKHLKRFTLLSVISMMTFQLPAAPVAAFENTDAAITYPMQRQTAVDDHGMFQQFAEAYHVDGYFLSADFLLSDAAYDSDAMLDAAATLALGWNLRTSNHAVIDTQTRDMAEKASEILQAYFPSPEDGEIWIDPAAHTRLHILDLQKDELDPQRMKATFDQIYTELLASDIQVDGFYYPWQIYEHHKLYVPYLTGYSASKNPNTASHSLTIDQLQHYIDTNSLPCTIQVEERKTDFIYNIVPDEALDFQSHFQLVLQIWNDLQLIPYAYDDSFSSFFPPLFALQGDSNANGKVDIGDAVMTMKYLTSNGHMTDPFAGDMNADGIVDAVDFTILKRKLLGD